MSKPDADAATFINATMDLSIKLQAAVLKAQVLGFTKDYTVSLVEEVWDNVDKSRSDMKNGITRAKNLADALGNIKAKG